MVNDLNNQQAKKTDSENISENLRTYLKFLSAVENLSDDPADYTDLIHWEAEFREMPNLLNKTGQMRDLEASLEGLKKAKIILADQRYEIAGYTEAGEKLAIEKIWTGRLSMDVANLKRIRNSKLIFASSSNLRKVKFSGIELRIATSLYNSELPGGRKRCS